MSLSYISGIADRMPILDSILGDCVRGTARLYTSDISRVEVAFAASEKEQRALDSETEQRIDSLWSNTNIITMVELHNDIAKEARTLIRDAMTNGWSLKPLDAIHLATAQWLSKMGIAIAEFHTYDTRLFRYSTIVGFKIMNPYTLNLSLL